MGTELNSKIKVKLDLFESEKELLRGLSLLYDTSMSRVMRALIRRESAKAIIVKDNEDEQITDKDRKALREIIDHYELSMSKIVIRILKRKNRDMRRRRWADLKEEAGISRAERRGDTELLDAIAALGGKATCQQIANHLKKTPTNVHSQLKRACAGGIIIKDGFIYEMGEE